MAAGAAAISLLTALLLVRRITVPLAQAAFPLFVYLAAVIVPAIVYARRRGMERWG